MPYLMHAASRSHCFVGFVSASRISSARRSHSLCFGIFCFFICCAIISAVFSALLLLLRKTSACLFFSIVSMTIFVVALSVYSLICMRSGIRKREKERG